MNPTTKLQVTRMLTVLYIVATYPMAVMYLATGGSNPAYVTMLLAVSAMAFVILFTTTVNTIKTEMRVK